MSSLSRRIASPVALARRVPPEPVRSAPGATYDQLSYGVAGLPPRRLRGWRQGRNALEPERTGIGGPISFSGIHLHHCLCVIAMRPNDTSRLGHPSQPK